VEITPDGRPVWRSYILERAFVCRNTGWRVLPEELDEASLEVKHATESLYVFEAFRQYATDLERLSPDQQKLIDGVERMRELLTKGTDD
jgi:hypothetical protein